MAETGNTVIPDSWRNAAAAGEIDTLLELRDPVNEKLEDLRSHKLIGKSVEAALKITVGESTVLAGLLRKYTDQLPELFIVSDVAIGTAPTEEILIEVRVAEGERCPRCWRTVTEMADTSLGAVCHRCEDAVKPYLD